MTNSVAFLLAQTFPKHIFFYYFAYPLEKGVSQNISISVRKSVVHLWQLAKKKSMLKNFA